MAKARLGRPSKAAKEDPEGSKSDVIFLRGVPDLVAGLDAWLEKLNVNKHGPKWSRTALARAAIDRAIREWGSKGEAP